MIIFILQILKKQKNIYIKGSTLSKQLSRDNGEKVIYKNYYVGKIDKLIEEFNYLSNKNITSNDKFNEFQNKFELHLEKFENELDRLDSRIATLNKLYSALDFKDSEHQNIKNLAEEIISKLKIPITTNKAEVKRLLNEVVIERDILN